MIDGAQKHTQDGESPFLKALVEFFHAELSMLGVPEIVVGSRVDTVDDDCNNEFAV